MSSRDVLSNAPSTPEQQAMLDKAKKYHNINTPGMPPEWAFDASGKLVDRANGVQIGVAEPGSAPGSSFLGQLLHASPYIAGAFGMGALGGLGGGAEETASVLGPSTAANMGATTTALAAGGPAAPAGIAAGGGGSSLLGAMSGTKAMTGIADVMGGAARSGADANYKNDYLKTILENSKLNRDKFAVAAPGQRLQDSTKASLASNFTPSKVDWGPGGFTPGAGARGVQPTFTGGFSGGMQNLDPRTKQLQSRVMDDELQGQLSGGATGGNQDRAMPTDIGKSSTLDKLTGAGAFGTSILSAIMKAYGH